MATVYDKTHKVQPPKLPEREMLNYFNRFFEPAKRHQQALADNWSELEKAYLGEPSVNKPGGDDAWRSHIFYKYGFQQVQTLAAELNADDAPTFVYEGRTPEQDEYAKTAEAIVGYQLERDDYALKRLQATITAAVYGGQPIKVHWRYECVVRKVLKSSGLHEETKLVVLDQPTLTLVDPRDFFYDVRARSMSEARYAFHRMRLSYEELEGRKRADGRPLYKNLDKLRDFVQGDGTDDGMTRDLDNDLAGEREKARQEGIEVVEMWTRDRLIVRAAGKFIIRDEENPYYHGRLPFEVATLQPSLNDVWGMPIMWLLRDVQELLHTLVNASMDQLKMSINPPLAIDVTADPDNMSRTLKPGAKYPGRGEARSIVEPIRVTGAEQFVSQQAIDGAVAQMKQITGITDELSGQSQTDTATQAALNQRQAKGRVGVMLRVIDFAFARCAEMMLQLNQQYLDLSKPVKLMGPDGQKQWRHIAPKEISGLWDVKPHNSSDRVVKELKRENLMNALSALLPANGITFADGKTVNLSEIVSELAESFDLPPDSVVVPSEMMFQANAAQTIAQAKADAEAQQILAPPAPAGEPQSPAEGMQMKLYESINYKDLPNEAQAAMLEQVGLPASGVETDDENPTRQPSPDKVAEINAPNPISEGLNAYSGSKKGA